MALFSLCFLLANILTATRYPFVWIDEVMYADPAVNLYQGLGFTSGAWYAQHSAEFWAGNVPLHSALLYLWIKLFGFSITVVRSINYFYLVASALLLWRACVRLPGPLLSKPWARLLLLVLMACGYSMIFSYRSGRPDCVAMLLVCASVYVSSRDCWRQRIFGVMSLSFLMPWAGLQLLPMMAVAGVLLVLYLGKRIVPVVLACWSGIALGGATLFWFYHSHGVWAQFVASARQHTSLGFFGWLARGEFRHSNLVPKDFSFMALFLLALPLGLTQIQKRNFKSPVCFGLLYSILLTLALLISGKFPTYYGWMTYVPLCVCVCMGLERIQFTALSRGLCGIALSATIAVGVLPHLAAAIYDWSDRDYAHVEKLVRENVNSSDWMYGEHSTFYAAKLTASRSFFPLYLTAFTDDEKSRLTVLVIAPMNFNEVTNALGGNWQSTGKKFTPERSGFLGSKKNLGFLSMQNYELEVYRRAANP